MWQRSALVLTRLHCRRNDVGNGLRRGLNAGYHCPSMAQHRRWHSRSMLPSVAGYIARSVAQRGRVGRLARLDRSLPALLRWRAAACEVDGTPYPPSQIPPPPCVYGGNTPCVVRSTEHRAHMARQALSPKIRKWQKGHDFAQKFSGKKGAVRQSGSLVSCPSPALRTSEIRSGNDSPREVWSEADEFHPPRRVTGTPL